MKRTATTLLAAGALFAGLASPDRANGQENDENRITIIPALQERLSRTKQLTVRLTKREKAKLVASLQGRIRAEFCAISLRPTIEAARYLDQRQPGQEFIGFVRHSWRGKRRQYLVYRSDGTMYLHGGGKADPSFRKEPWRGW